MSNELTYTLRPQWCSYKSYVLVTAGSIIGIGNVLLFPFLVSQYGGLFILLYLLCELVLSVPLFFSELLIGTKGKQNPVGCFHLAAYENKGSSRWQKLGWLYFVIAFLTFSYYLIYTVFPISFLTSGLHALFQPNSAGLAPIINTQIFQNFYALELCVLFLLLSTLFIIWRGIHRGLEIISYFTVPLYILIFIGLFAFTVLQDGMMEAINNLFTINKGVSFLSVFAAALTFSFLKLKVGVGSNIIYASHLPFSVPLKSSGIWIILLDILVSLLCYFIIFPLMHAPNFEMIYYVADFSRNDAIVFKAAPYSLIIGSLFFFAAVLASWTTLIAMLETIVSTLSEEFNRSRSKIIIWVGLSLAAVASFLILSQTTSIMGNLHYTKILREIALDKLMPLAVFFLSIFSGWILKRDVVASGLNLSPALYAAWRFLMRYVIPVLLISVFIFNFF